MAGRGKASEWHVRCLEPRSDATQRAGEPGGAAPAAIARPGADSLGAWDEGASGFAGGAGLW
ncbi:MAG TPA: hypothetical protein VGK27_03765 [Candidatus Deferrimicrobiaceae bacterium]